MLVKFKTTFFKDLQNALSLLSVNQVVGPRLLISASCKASKNITAVFLIVKQENIQV